MKTRSSDRYGVLHPEGDLLRKLEQEQHAAVGRQLADEHEAALAALVVGRDPDREVVRPLRSPGLDLRLLERGEQGGRAGAGGNERKRRENDSATSSSAGSRLRRLGDFILAQ